MGRVLFGPSFSAPWLHLLSSAPRNVSGRNASTAWDSQRELLGEERRQRLCETTDLTHAAADSAHRTHELARWCVVVDIVLSRGRSSARHRRCSELVERSREKATNSVLRRENAAPAHWNTSIG